MMRTDALIQRTRVRRHGLAFFRSALWSAAFAALCFASGALHGADRMPLLMPDDFESLELVAWRVEEGVPDPHNPLLEPSMPWDAGGIMGHGTVLHDPIDGLWKAWQVSMTVEPETKDLTTQNESVRRLTYLESKDGVRWYRPKLPFVSWPGHKETNIIFDFDSGGTAQYASVLIDPRNKAEPYEMFVLRSPMRAKVPNKVGSLPGPEGKYGMYRYRSSDGKAWRLTEGPLDAIQGGGDVCYVYREPDGSYVSYFKAYPPLAPGDRIIPYDVNGRQLLRKVARATSPDGTHWSKAEVVLARDFRDPGYTQFLEICPVKVEGGYVGLVNYYDASIQTMCVVMAASRDGIHWWRPDRRPALPNPPLGEYGGGLMWQMQQPTVEGGRMYVYYSGVEGIHSPIIDTRFQPQIEVSGESVIGFESRGTLPFYGALCRASWEADRLWALAPAAGGPHPARATTHPRELRGTRLEVNVRVKGDGELRAEFLDKDGAPLPGFTLQDCRPVKGDHRLKKVDWTGGDRAPAGAARIRFVLRRAFLYGYVAAR